MVEDPSPDPGSIAKQWFVWHEDTQRMREATENTTDPEIYDQKKGWFSKKEIRKIDHLVIQSVVGFEVTGIPTTNGFVGIQSLFLRHPSLFYGRPVYESENGGQFLYWKKTNGTILDGLEKAMLECPGILVESKENVDDPGHWIISKELGLGCMSDEQKKDDSGETFLQDWHKDVLAYVEDTAFSPDQIYPVKPKFWCIRDKNPHAVDKFEQCASMKLRLEEWSHESQVDLRMLDGVLDKGADDKSKDLLALEDKASPRSASSGADTSLMDASPRQE
jgi:hypothetical protein